MNRWLLVFLLVLTGLRLVISSQNEISPDESYYYQWSQRLDWAYYSKGPGAAMAIAAGTSLFGPTEIGIRFWAPLLALGTSLLLYQLGRRLYSEEVGIWAAVLLNITPIFQAGSLVLTIDALSIFFWTAALLTFWQALQRAPAFSVWWPFTGLVIGLGFLAKYTNVVQLISIVLILASTRRLRAEFRKPGFWSLIGVFSLSLIPPIIWNVGHQWVTLQHLRERGNLEGSFAFHPEEVLVYLGMHFGVYSPIIFGAMLVALYTGCREARVHFRPRFLVAFSLPLLVMYFSLSINKAGQANWTAPAFISLSLLLVAYSCNLARRAVWARRLAAGGLALAAVMSLLLANLDAVRVLGYPLPYTLDPSSRLRGWKTVAEEVGRLRERMEKEEGKRFFLIGNKYQTSSMLAFYLPEKRVEGPGHPPVYIPESQHIQNQYSFFPRYDELTDMPTLARLMLPGVEDAALKERLSKALAEAGKADPKDTGDDAVFARKELVSALLAADPTLPVDEYASEEAAISLFHGRDALFITDAPGDDPPSALQKGFEKVEVVALWHEKRRGLPLREVRVFVCRNYHTLPL